MITIHQRHRQTDRQTDRQTTCDRNTALRTKVHSAVKTKWLVSYYIVLRFSHGDRSSFHRRYWSDPVGCSSYCATMKQYTILLLKSSSGNTPNYCWPNHMSDVANWSSSGYVGLLKTSAIQFVRNRFVSFLKIRFSSDLQKWSSNSTRFCRLARMHARHGQMIYRTLITVATVYT